MSDIDDCAESVKRLTSDRGEVMRAGNDKIEAIRARHAVYPPRPGAPHGFFIAHQDIATLLAEIERFREALTDIANQETTGPYKWQLVVARLCEIAREALEGRP